MDSERIDLMPAPPLAEASVAASAAATRVAGNVASGLHENGTGACCAACAERSAAQSEGFVYVIGRLETRFPSLGIEREFQHRQAQLPESLGPGLGQGERVRRVLAANRHLLPRMGYVFMVTGFPAYVVAPTSAYLRDDLLEAVAHAGDPDRWCVLIGRLGPVAAPSVCAGVLAPMVACDQLLVFSVDGWLESLEERLARVLNERRIDRQVLDTTAQELFGQVVQSTENVGATDSHRALNYVLMQHPGLVLAAAERSGRQSLDRIETRSIHGLGSRRLVTVVITFVDRATGVAERLFCRVDVTEEWPFIADGRNGTRCALALAPFIENELLGVAY